MTTFDDFWKLYPPRGRTPRKTKKHTARASWARLSMIDRESAMEGLERAKVTRDWLEPAFIPHASVWLNQRRWEDEDGNQELPYSPKEKQKLASWRNRVGGGYCPVDHGEPQCASVEDCDEKQLRVWTKRGEL